MLQDSQPTEASHTSLHLRPGTADDIVATHKLFLESISDLVWRIGIQEGDRLPSEEERAEDLRRWRPMLDHLTATADQFWVAERDDQVVGFARSILRDGVRELTEFFVSPQAQAGGVGRELLARAMPPGARRIYIMATLDLRAQARYHKLGVYQVCAVYTFFRKLQESTPESAPVSASVVVPAANTPQGDLTFITITPEHIPMLAKLDQAIHGHQRHADHNWLMASRKGFLLLRGQRAAGYGYVGEPYSGPFVLLDDRDYPAALAHAESIALADGYESMGLDVPMLNHTAIKYLLDRGYHMSPFFCFYMCNEQPLHVDKTIITARMIMI